jgi:Protein-tyrosine-phosphatase-like, N-terminal domain
MLVDVVDRLALEFDGEFSHDKVETIVEESAASWKDATVQTFIPLLAEKASRKRLKSLLIR